MAANTLLSELGGKVIMGSRHDENIETYLGDGSVKAGWLCGVDNADMTLAGSDDGSGGEFFVGIALPRYDTDCDTAYTANDLVDVVIPISGHYYAVYGDDVGATLLPGHMFSFSADPGCVLKCSTFDGSSDIQTIATNKETVITGTRFLIIRWL